MEVGVASLAGFAQTKTLEARNSKLTATRYLETCLAKFILPNKQHKGSKRRDGNGRPKKNRNGKNRASRDLVGGGKSASSTPTRITESWMPLFPSSITKTLRYSTSFNLGAAVGAVSTYVFRANDLFDPDFTGTGHQPMGFDQLMLWYNHFCVIRARIKVTFKNYGTTTVCAAVRQDASPTPITVIDRIIEDGALTMDTLEMKAVSGSNTTLSMDISMCRLQGVSRSAITADPTLRGDSATSPTEVSYFHVACWDTTALATTNVYCDVVLEQTAVFMEPRDVIESLKVNSCRVSINKPVTNTCSSSSTDHKCALHR